MTSASDNHYHSRSSHSGEESFSKSVSEIGDAEAQAKRMLEKAEGQRLEILASAKKKAAEMLEKAAAEGEKAREGIIAEERGKIEGENKAVLEKAKAKASEFKKKPVKQLAKSLAVELLPRD